MIVPLTFVGAWFLMIGIGVWHSSQSVIPTIGYLPSLLITMAVAIIVSAALPEPPSSR